MKIKLIACVSMCCWGGVNLAAQNNLIISATTENQITETVESLTDTVESEEETADEPQWPASMVSGTLPIMYINTENNVPILDKVTQIPAGLWIEIPEGCDDVDFALGSSDNPVKLTIRGRGNSSWLAEKKPYKLKFSSKTAILGMPKHKHFALLAANTSQVLGMELARQAGLGWAPRSYPVEVVLNGEYIGLYNMFESVKIDSNRLDIFEQEDLCEDIETVPYGWLVEIDNYDDECQIVISKPECTEMKVTYHSPEELTDMQSQWLIGEFTAINEVINSADPSEREHWTDYIDAKSMGQYFIVREILQDYDGFNGSTYMYRDNEGENTRWKMGPMWDCQFNAWDTPTDWTMNQLPVWSKWKILPEIFYTQSFNAAFNDAWSEFYPSRLDNVRDYMIDYAEKCQKADLADGARWPNKNAVISVPNVKTIHKYLERRAEWIDDNKQIYQSSSANIIGVDSEEPVSTVIYTLSGTRVENLTTPGIYIKETRYSGGKTIAEKITIK